MFAIISRSTYFFFECLQANIHNYFSGGHYTAYVKHCQSQSWNLFNDAQVESRIPDGDNQDDAYILFYKRSGLSHNLHIPNFAAKTSK